MNTGGPAFPQHGWSKDPQVLERMRNQGGMTLLDWFAGQALAGSLASQSKESHWAFATVEDDTADDRATKGICALCYDLATAMLAERARCEAVVKESSTTDHSGEAGKMIPDPFAEDALRQLASDVLPADIKDAASEERLTWCAEQVRAQVNTLEAQNRELVERIKRLEEAGNEVVWWFCQKEESQLSSMQSAALKRWRDLRGRRSP